MIDSKKLLGMGDSLSTFGSHNIRELLDSTIFYSNPPHCEKILYRRFDLTQVTEYWDPEKKEALGGYKHPYTDSILLARFSWYARGTEPEELMMIGKQANEEPYAHLRYDTAPKIEDFIFTFKEQPLGTTIHSDHIEAQYDIIRVVAYKDINGRVEFYTCILKEVMRDKYQ